MHTLPKRPETKENKKMILTYCDPIAIEAYEYFEEQINYASIRNRDIVFYLTTNGGSMALAQNMIDIINNYPHDFEIVVSGHCYSAGLYIISNVNRKIRISPATSGMAHFPYTEINTKALKDEDSWDYFQLETEKEFIDEYLKNIKQILTEKEIQKIFDGKEVWLKTERMVELINSLQNKTQSV